MELKVRLHLRYSEIETKWAILFNQSQLCIESMYYKVISSCNKQVYTIKGFQFTCRKKGDRHLQGSGYFCFDFNSLTIKVWPSQLFRAALTLASDKRGAPTQAWPSLLASHWSTLVIPSLSLVNNSMDTDLHGARELSINCAARAINHLVI